MPDALSLAMAIVLGLICLASGLLLGALPIKNAMLTERQRRASSLLCFVICIAYIVLMFCGQDLSTWTMLGGIIFGFLIAKIPPLHAFLVAHWSFLKPNTPKASHRSNRK